MAKLEIRHQQYVGIWLFFVVWLGLLSWRVYYCSIGVDGRLSLNASWLGLVSVYVFFRHLRIQIILPILSVLLLTIVPWRGTNVILLSVGSTLLVLYTLFVAVRLQPLINANRNGPEE